PSDPQPGNIPGGRRDVLRSADFNDGQMQAFARDTGAFAVNGGLLEVAAQSQGGDAAAVWYVDAYLPIFYEIHARVLMQKATGGWKANAYVIFDYFSPTDFKFAGIDDSTNKLVMGYRDANGWHVVRQAAVQGGIKANKWYDLVVYVNGTTVWVDVAGKTAFTHTFAPRLLNDELVGLNKGLIGVGSDNARGKFDNLSVQVLPPNINVDVTEDFDDGFGMVVEPALAGDWAAADGVLTGQSGVGASAGLATVDVGGRLEANAYLEVTIDLRLSAGGAGGFFFDAYGDDDYKFVVLDLAAQQVLIGHVAPGRGRTVDAAQSLSMTAGTPLVLLVTIKGASISAQVNGAFGGSWAFNSAVADGAFGLLVEAGTMTVDDVRVRTNGLIGTAATTSAPAPDDPDDPSDPDDPGDPEDPGGGEEGGDPDPPPPPPPPPPVPDPTVSFAAGSMTVTEGDSGHTLLSVEIVLSDVADHDVVVWVETSDGSATAGEDYVPVLVAVTIAAGQTSATIEVAIVGDNGREGDETFTLGLVDPEGATFGGQGTTTVTIANDDKGGPRP
ncbi:MAG TPA: Calx-beta domain-containing protein, partial [Nitriliruptoraceae bacterium]|nr:Calx-beta domain-containing protein [Nitriliruptoraceae bacterium]